ncbi:LuxR C-terminal-related transcriptional regulator [Novosphingobium sp. BL-52-GroH]|uniref:LuxR C-terminal-related transcriptional regulator n=1 Tax=Novosphingobium sp. BL-52-GroH TaxID=3349877 RepID=UPI00384E7ECE
MNVVPTTILPPRVMRTVVSRKTIEDLTEKVARSRLTAVSAPAGSGKTTAILYWADRLREQGRPVLWLAARAGISGKASFLQALQAAGNAAGLDWQDLTADAPDESWLRAIATHQAVAPVIVIDDAQLLEAPILEFVAQLSASARDALTIIVAARGAIGLPLARMRALGFLVEVGNAELCFTLAEATELITRSVAGPVDTQALHDIVRDTQGWVSGIVIACELYRHESPGSTNLRITGLRPEFAEYFHEEVVGQQPEDIRRFLVDTSILDELTPAACAAVTGDENARTMLDRVFRQGLFLHAIDEEHSRYSYHRMFREMVLGRLMDRAPSRAAVMHKRASRHFAGQGQLQVAIEHARLSGDMEFLADQLDRLADPLTYSGFLYRVDELGAEMPWTLLERRPHLLLALAWRRIRQLSFVSADRFIAAAQKTCDEQRASGDISGHDADQLQLIIRHRLVMLHAARDDMVSVEAQAETLLVELSDGHAYLNCTLLAQLMSARRELYHFSDMLKLEAETRVALARPGSGFASIALKASVAPTLMAQGKTQFARRFLEEALGLARQIHGEGSGLAALPALPLAELLYDANDLSGAAALVESYLPVVREWAFADQMASGYLVNARLRAAHGDLPGALSTLNDAHLVAIECGLERLRAIVVAEEVRLLVKAGQIEEAERHFLAGDPQLDGEPIPTLRPTRRNESIAIAWLRIEMQRHRLGRARKVAYRWLEFVKRSGATRSAVTFELLLAEIAVLQGNRSEARRAVRAAVEMAEPAGWVRVFIDEGEVISSLLVEAYSNGPELETPADRFAVGLVSLMRAGPKIRTDEEVEEDDDDFGLTGRLANREVDILTMVGGGLRNREIGDRLGLTEGTVKWYMQQIYDKLGVRRRPQAVLRARQLGILP